MFKPRKLRNLAEANRANLLYQRADEAWRQGHSRLAYRLFLRAARAGMTAAFRIVGNSTTTARASAPTRTQPSTGTGGRLRMVTSRPPTTSVASGVTGEDWTARCDGSNGPSSWVTQTPIWKLLRSMCARAICPRRVPTWRKPAGHRGLLSNRRRRPGFCKGS